MLINNIINKNISVLKPSDTVEIAEMLMITQGLNNLPVVSENRLVNQISLKELMDYDKGIVIKDIKFATETKPLIRENQSIFSIITLLLRSSINCIAVQFKDEYAGVVTINDLLSKLFSTTVKNENTSVIGLEMPLRDYTLTQLANIIESHDLKIVNLLTETDIHEIITIHISLNHNQIQGLLSSLDRFKYKVVYAINGNGQKARVDDRYISLLKHFDI